MKLSTKILIIVGVVLTIGILGFIIYKQKEISDRQIAIQTQVAKQAQLADNITRSQNEYSTSKNLDQFIKDNNLNFDAIKNDLNKLHAEVNAANTVSIHSNGYTASNLNSTSTGIKNPEPTKLNCDGKEINCNPDPHGYYVIQQKLSLSEPFNNIQIPIGLVGFSAWQDKPWEVDIKPREYKVVNVIGTDENQRTYFYNKFMVKTDGKTYEVKIDNAQTEEVYPSAKLSFWNPRLYLGAAGGFNIGSTRGEANANLQFSFLSYGRYRGQSDWVFLSFGPSYQLDAKKLALIVTPFSYNINSIFPLFKNVYLGPSFTLDLNSNFAAMLGVTVGL